MGLTSTFQSWLDHKLKNGVYELRGTEIVCGRGSKPEHRFSVAELESWRIYPEMGFDLVVRDVKKAIGESRK